MTRFIRTGKLAAFALAVCMVLASSLALAADFVVTPLRVDFSAKKKIASLTLKNVSSYPVLMQVEVSAWSQKNGRDVLTPTNDIMSAPPVFTIPAHKAQVIRLALMRAVDPSKELSYRVFLNQVPDKTRRKPGTIAVVIHMGLPVFVAPVAKEKENWKWSAVKLAGKQIKLTMVNLGNTHFQLGKVRLYGNSPKKGEKALFDKTLGTYVLPGKTCLWKLRLNGPVPKRFIFMKAMTGDQRKFETKVPLTGK